MPVFSRAVLCGVQAVALVVTVGHVSGPLAVTAAPIPVPAPVAAHLADYASQPPARSSTAAVPQLSALRRAEDVTVVKHTTSSAAPLTRRQGQLMDGLGGLQQQMALLQGSDAAQGPLQALLQPLVDMMANLTPLKNVLADGPNADKGLANYDSSNQLETLLKNAVNSLKYTMNGLVAMFRTIDFLGLGLGPALADILYYIKCIVDGLLDFLENFTDGTLNDGVVVELQRVLAQLQMDLSDAACTNGFSVAGILCL